METHATEMDIPILRKGLRESVEDEVENCHRICHILKAFARFPSIGSVPELHQILCEFRYSFGRELAANAMKITDSDRFMNQFAHECLWDCESGTRALACNSVADSCNASVVRLRELAKDEFEDPDVRAVAAKRLPSV